MRQERRKKSLTQEQLAEKALVSVDTVKRYESGKYEGIQLVAAYSITEALEVPLSSLVPLPKSSLEQLLDEMDACIQAMRSSLQK